MEADVRFIPWAEVRAKHLAALQTCPNPDAGLEPCPRCGGRQRWETSHSRCEACHWITPCCEGAALPDQSSV